MAKAIETLSIKLEFKDAGTQAIIDKVKNSFKGLERVVSGNTKPAIQKLRNEINTFASTGNRSISTIDSQVTALRALRREADINSKEFKELTADISKFERQLGKAKGRGPGGGRGNRALAATQTAGAVISGGIFGGPEGAIGGALGAIGGGVGGAYLGAALGAQVGMVRQSLGGVAETVAEINSMKIALAGVSENAEDYKKSFDNVINISKQFLVPIDKSIGQFTRLKAAVVGAGFGTKETTEVFKGFSAAILATGGDSEKLSGALLAASQVFSKNKVQAEELRGQIGERLPGSFNTFAQAIGVSTRELDDMLKKGIVSTENFVEFSRTLFARYARTADTLGSSPEKAGQRLQLALSLATLEYGGFFQKVGAGFQDYLTGLVTFAVNNKETFKQVAANVLLFADDLKLTVQGLITNFTQTFGEFFAFLGRLLKGFFDNFVVPFFDGIMKGVNFIKRELQSAQARRIVSPERQAEIKAKARESFFEDTGRERVKTAEVKAGQGTTRTIEVNPLNLLEQADIRAREQSMLIEEAGLGSGQRLKEITKEIEKAFEVFDPTSGFATSLGDTSLTGGTGDTGGSAAKIAEREADAFDQILARLTKRNALEAETNKFERERIKIRTRAAQDISQIDERVADNRKRELFDLVEIGRLEGLRKIDAEELDAQVKETLSMDFASLLKKEQSKIQKFVTDAQDSLKDLQQVAVNVAQGIGNAVANSLTSGVMGLIEGTQNAKEVFANFLKSVGQILAQEGAKMIATYIAIGIAKLFAGMPGFGKPGSFETGTGLTGFASQPSTAGFNPSGLFTPAANGGPVNAGRPYMVGERGPELFIPGSNGGIMRNEDMRRMMGSSPAGAGAPQMNFTFETTNIGGTEFVSREQLEQAMVTTRRQATNDGAKRGMSMTLDKMQNSPRTRSRVGIS